MQHYNEELIALLLQHGAQATSAFNKVRPLQPHCAQRRWSWIEGALRSD
jgi:hypothetical protein